MRAWGLVLCAVAVAVGACLHTPVTECDDLACPSNKVCHGALGCVYPEQLSRCDGAADGTACSFTGQPDGSCEGALCLPLGCGNGFKTSDEVCDDGNNVSGDRCSANCQSVEICGNGILDTAASEQCDDGNTDDFDDCRNDCVLPRCNDGFVDPLEECDPSASSAIKSCTDFGYYSGELVCGSSCRYDPAASCSGRCGDGVLQSDQGEECDGGLPTFSCVDAGFDFGAIKCSPTTCTGDTVHSCSRYGWTYVHDVASVARVAGDGDTLVVVNPLGNGLEIGEVTGWTHLDGAYIDADVLGDRIVAVKSTSVQLRDQGTWTALPDPPLAATTSIREVVLAADGAPLVLACDDAGLVACDVHAFDQGAWTSTTLVAGSSHLAAVAHDDFAIATGSTVVWTYPGGSRTDVVTGTIFKIVPGTSLTVHSYQESNSTLDRTLITKTGTSAPIELAMIVTPSSLVAFGDDVYGWDSVAPNTMLQGTFGRVEQVTLPVRVPSIARQLVLSRDGRLYATGNPKTNGVGLYRLGPFAENERTIPMPSGGIGLVGRASDGAWLVCDQHGLYTSFGTGFQSFPYDFTATPQVPCASPPWGPTRGVVYVAAFPGFQPRLFRHRTIWNEEFFLGAPILASQVTGEGTVGIVVQRNSAQMLFTTGGAWSPLRIAPCNVTAATIVQGTIYAAGRCTGNNQQIWKLASTAATVWTTLYSTNLPEGFTSLFVAPDGTIAAATKNDHVVVVGIGGVFQTFPGLGNVVSGTGANDLYAVFSASGLNSALHRWDGVSWTPMRIDPSVFYMSINATTRDLAIVGEDPRLGLVRGQ